MKIIKPGKIKSIPMTCDMCDCEFEYDKRDIQYIHKGLFALLQPGDLEGVDKVVVCPTCGVDIVVEKGFIRKLKDDTWTDVDTEAAEREILADGR